MKNNELLFGQSGARRLDDLSQPLAEAYQAAFAGDPWYEASRCTNDACDEGFTACVPGDGCAACGQPLEQAYKTDELAAGWRQVIANEDGLMEVGFLNGDPVRATIVRPTTPRELYERKYADMPAMGDWTQANLNRDLVWIEDTFANREKSPSGNMKGRGQTLAAIALRYNGLAIATRTLAPAIIAPTLRDAGQNTDMFVGTEGVGARMLNARRISTVPDRRTLLTVTEMEVGNA
jgi:hypothetical protein